MGVDIYKAESSYVWGKAVEANPELNDKTCVIAPEGLIVQGTDYDNSFKGIPHIHETNHFVKPYLRPITYNIVDQNDQVGYRPSESLVEDNIIVIHWNDNSHLGVVELTGAPIDLITSRFIPVLVNRITGNSVELENINMTVGRSRYTIINAQQDGQEVRITIDPKHTDEDSMARWLFDQIGKHAAIRGGYIDVGNGNEDIIVQNILTITGFQNNDDGTAVVTGTLEEGDILTDNPSDYHLSRYAYLDGTSGDVMMYIPDIHIGTRNDGPDHYVYLSLETTSYTPVHTCGINLSMVPLFSMSRDTYFNLPDYVKEILDSSMSISLDGYDEVGAFSIPFPGYSPSSPSNLADTMSLVDTGVFNLLSLQDYMTLYWVLVAETGRFNVPNTNLGYYQWYTDPDPMSSHFKPNTETEITYNSKSYRWHGILNLFRGLPILLNGGMASFNTTEDLNIVPTDGSGNRWHVAINSKWCPMSPQIENPDNVDYFFTWMSEFDGVEIIQSPMLGYNQYIVTARVSNSGLLIPTKAGTVLPYNPYNGFDTAGVFFTTDEPELAVYNYKYVIANPMWDQASYHSSGLRIGTVDENFKLATGMGDELKSIHPLVFVTY